MRRLAQAEHDEFDRTGEHRGELDHRSEFNHHRWFVDDHERDDIVDHDRTDLDHHGHEHHGHDDVRQPASGRPTR